MAMIVGGLLCCTIVFSEIPSVSLHKCTPKSLQPHTIQLYRIREIEHVNSIKVVFQQSDLQICSIRQASLDLSQAIVTFTF